MLKQFISISCMLCSLVLWSGCSVYRVDSQDTTLDFFPPKSSVDQVSYVASPERPHEIIGVVTLTADRAHPFAEAVDRMRQEAAILGGDAITDIRVGPDSFGGTSKGKKRTVVANIFEHYSAKVIVFK